MCFKILNEFFIDRCITDFISHKYKRDVFGQYALSMKRAKNIAISRSDSNFGRLHFTFSPGLLKKKLVH